VRTPFCAGEPQDKIRAQLPPTQKDVGVAFVNKMQDVYVPPKPKFDFAKSQGLALGARYVHPSGAEHFLIICVIATKRDGLIWIMFLDSSKLAIFHIPM
jgi:hypothetical protein